MHSAARPRQQVLAVLGRLLLQRLPPLLHLVLELQHFLQLHKLLVDFNLEPPQQVPPRSALVLPQLLEVFQLLLRHHLVLVEQELLAVVKKKTFNNVFISHFCILLLC